MYCFANQSFVDSIFPKNYFRLFIYPSDVYVVKPLCYPIFDIHNDNNYIATIIIIRDISKLFISINHRIKF